jgi:hypothetical protein
MVVNAARGSHMTDGATKLTQLLQPELAKPAEAQDAVEAKKHRREELKARLAKDAAKRKPQARRKQSKTNAASRNSRRSSPPGIGQGFIIGMPAGAPKPLEGAD